MAKTDVFQYKVPLPFCI